MATTKDPKTPKIDDDFLAGIKNADNTNDKTTNFETRQDRRTVEPAKTSTPATSDKVKVTLLVNKNVRKDWQQFCLNNDITLTDAIQIAMNHVINEVENNNAKISKGGFRK